MSASGYLQRRSTRLSRAAALGSAEGSSGIGGLSSPSQRDDAESARSGVSGRSAGSKRSLTAFEERVQSMRGNLRSILVARREDGEEEAEGRAERSGLHSVDRRAGAAEAAARPSVAASRILEADSDSGSEHWDGRSSSSAAGTALGRRLPAPPKAAPQAPVSGDPAAAGRASASGAPPPASAGDGGGARPGRRRGAVVGQDIEAAVGLRVRVRDGVKVLVDHPAGVITQLRCEGERAQVEHFGPNKDRRYYNTGKNGEFQLLLDEGLDGNEGDPPAAPQARRESLDRAAPAAPVGAAAPRRLPEAPQRAEGEAPGSRGAASAASGGSSPRRSYAERRRAGSLAAAAHDPAAALLVGQAGPDGPARASAEAAERGASPRAGYADRRRSAAPVDAAPAEEAAERGASPRASYAERRRSAAPVEVAPAGPAAAAAADVVLKSRVDHLEKEQGVLAWRLGEVEQRVSKGLDSLKAEQSAAALQLQEADQRVEQRVFEDLGSLKAEQSAAALHLQEFEQRVLADVRSSLREQDESRASRLDGLGERAAKEARAAVELAVGQLERSLARDLELLREETCRKLDVMERRVAEDSLLLKRVAEEAQRVPKEPPELAGAGPAAPSKAGAGKPSAGGLGREKPEPAREAGASDSSSAEVRAAPSGKRRIRRRHSERRSGSSDEAPSAEHKGRSRRHRVVESKATPQEKAREERTAGREEPDLTGPEAMQQLLEMRRAAASVTGGAAFRGGEEEHSDCDEPAARGGAIHRAAARSAAAARAAQGPADGRRPSAAALPAAARGPRASAPAARAEPAGAPPWARPQEHFAPPEGEAAPPRRASAMARCLEEEDYSCIVAESREKSVSRVPQVSPAELASQHGHAQPAPPSPEFGDAHSAALGTPGFGSPADASGFGLSPSRPPRQEGSGGSGADATMAGLVHRAGATAPEQPPQPRLAQARGSTASQPRGHPHVGSSWAPRAAPAEWAQRRTPAPPQRPEAAHARARFGPTEDVDGDENNLVF